MSGNDGNGKSELSDDEWDSLMGGLDTGPEPEDKGAPPSMRRFLGMEFPKREPVLGPFSSQQLTFVYARTGAGKTMFGLALAWALAEGVDFLSWKSQKAQRVLYVDGEMVAADIQQRMQKAPSDQLFIANICTWAAEIGIDPPNLTTQEGQDLITSWILKRNIDVVILDNLMSLAWMDGVSMNSDELWQPTRRWCVDQRSEGRSVILVDHTNAAGEIFGSKTKLWHVDNAIKLEAIKNDGDDETAAFDLKIPARKFSLEFVKQRGAAEQEQSVVVTAGDVGEEWTTELAGDALREKAREMKRNGLTVRDIVEELGVSKSVVGRWTKGIVPDDIPGLRQRGT